MLRARMQARQQRQDKSLIGSIRKFLTPEVFKQVRNATKRRKSPRWDLHPLLWILLLTTYCSGDSLPEKFEAARGFYVVCCPKRKRPGKSFTGFGKAVAKLPMPVLRALAVVATMMTEVDFIIRMSSNATFYSETDEPLERFREGIVCYWPKTQQKKGNPPLRGRLLRIRGVRRKDDVWLFTNVVSTRRLPLETAAVCYRWRWENEGFFRTYKRTLKKATLMGRTVAQVHREAEASMIAAQLLICQGAMAMQAVTNDGLPLMCSPRRVLLEARRDIFARKESTKPFAERIAGAERERRVRTSAKEKRKWPRRKPHTAPNPPILLRLTDEQKLIIHNQLQIT